MFHFLSPYKLGYKILFGLYLHALADKTTEDVEVIDDWEEEDDEVEAKVVSSDTTLPFFFLDYVLVNFFVLFYSLEMEEMVVGLFLEVWHGVKEFSQLLPKF